MQRYIKYSCLAVMVISAMVLIGWLLKLQVFTHVQSSLPSMNPLAAVVFFLSSIWILLVGKGKRRRKRYNWFLFPVATIVLILGALRLLDLAFPIRELIPISGNALLVNAAVSPPTALNFFLLGVTMIFSLLLYPKYKDIVLLSIPVILFVCLLSLFGYLVGENSIFTLKPYLPMALHTTVCFILLSVAFLFLFPKNDFMRTITGKEVGGYSARLWIPYIILIPFSLGLLNYYAVKHDVYGADFGMAVVVVSMIFIFLFITWRESKALNVVDREKNHARLELEVSNRKLVKLNAELEQFIFIASHDLREPLRKIMMFGDLLQRTPSERTQREIDLTAKMIKASSRMNALVTDILKYTRIMHQAAPFEEVDLNDLLGEVIFNFHVRISQQKATIIIGRLPRIKGIRFQLTELFSNLLDNSLKFSNKETSLKIVISCAPMSADDVRKRRLSTTRHYYCVTFQDNGIGFNHKYASKAFEIFQRLHVSQFEGSGIGLAICKKVILNHQGDIFAESEEGKGTTFFILLPEG